MSQNKYDGTLFYYAHKRGETGLCCLAVKIKTDFKPGQDVLLQNPIHTDV